MNEIREIGIEKELFLNDIKTDTLKEPKLYGFPYDEMGFLVEIRSLPSDRLYPVLTTLAQEEWQYKLRANKFDMELHDWSFAYGDKSWIDDIAERYKIYSFEDLTQNIYSKDKKVESHHLGIFPEGETCYKLTSGMHVHFSSRDSKTGKVIDLPIEKIVEKMDELFENEILESQRIKGEWEPKIHGFEYRSLPCNINVLKVLKEAFKILRSV